jgi:TPP-dependent pyruvate/acetoin dehydrogenase alpha subunit
VRRARAGEGPTLIECKTYRTRAHSEGMRDAGYRTQEEVDSWKARDPIKTYKQKLLDNGLPADDFEEIEADTQALIEDASEFAKASPWPDPATATKYIYSEVAHA